MPSTIFSFSDISPYSANLTAIWSTPIKANIKGKNNTVLNKRQSKVKQSYNKLAKK